MTPEPSSRAHAHRFWRRPCNTRKPRHAAASRDSPSQWGKDFLRYSSALPQTAQEDTPSSAAPRAGQASRWSQAGPRHAPGPAPSARAGRSQAGQAKRIFTKGYLPSKDVAGAVPNQLAGQLAEETEDHDDVQDAGGRLGRADAGGLPGHPPQRQRADEPQPPPHRQ